MKLGLCLNMIAAGADGTGQEWIGRLNEIGLDYVEIALAQAMALDRETFKDGLLAPLRDSSLTCLSCNNFFPASRKLTGPDADRPAALAYAEAALDMACELGATRVVFGSSGARNRPMGFPREAALDQLAELLGRLGELARARGLTIVLETLNTLESNVLNHLEESHALMKRVNDPNVRMLVDSFHAWMVGDTVERVWALGDDLRHVHVAHLLGRGLPCPGDEAPWEAFFGALAGIGYEGGVSMEAVVPGDDPIPKLRDAGAFLRRWVKG